MFNYYKIYSNYINCLEKLNKHNFVMVSMFSFFIVMVAYVILPIFLYFTLILLYSSIALYLSYKKICHILSMYKGIKELDFIFLDYFKSDIDKRKELYKTIFSLLISLLIFVVTICSAFGIRDSQMISFYNYYFMLIMLVGLLYLILRMKSVVLTTIFIISTTCFYSFNIISICVKLFTKWSPIK